MSIHKNFHKILFATTSVFALGLFLWKESPDHFSGLSYVGLLTLSILWYRLHNFKNLHPIAQLIMLSIYGAASLFVLQWFEIGVYRYLIFFYIRFAFAVNLIFFNRGEFLAEKDGFFAKGCKLFSLIYFVIIVLGFFFQSFFLRYGPVMMVFDVVIYYMLRALWS